MTPIFLAIALVFVGSFLHEIGNTVGKVEVERHVEGPFTMAFLNLFSSVFVLAAIALYRDSFVFQAASLPSFLLRAALEIGAVHLNAIAIVKSDRSSLGFLSVLAVPMLLAVDGIAGQQFSTAQLLGVAAIVGAIVLLGTHRGISRASVPYGLAGAVLSVATIALYRYDVAHFNSVEGEQIVMHLIMLCSLYASARYLGHEQPLALLRKKLVAVQSLSEGAGAVLVSFAFVLAPASLVLAARRSLGVLWTIVAGSLYFHEGHLAVKIVSLLGVAVGIVLLLV